MTAPDLSLKDSSQRWWFFVDLNLLLSDPTNDEIVFDRSPKDLNGLEKTETQYAQRILPCTELFSPGGFINWIFGIDDWLRINQPADQDVFRSKWRDKWTKAITAFQDFEVPVIELPAVDESDDHSIGRVCAIFEKLNSTGVELSVYDLLTARLYPHNIYLHDLWDKACEEPQTASRMVRRQGRESQVRRYGVCVSWGCYAASKLGRAISSSLIRRTSRRTGGAQQRRWNVHWNSLHSSVLTASGCSIPSGCQVMACCRFWPHCARRSRIGNLAVGRAKTSAAGTGRTCSWNATPALSRASPRRITPNCWRTGRKRVRARRLRRRPRTHRRAYLQYPRFG